jgi:ABC-type Fe3+ transport system permease subunit
MKEFTIPLMLYSPDNVVLSVLLLQLHQAGSSAAAAATGLVMTALGMLGVAGLMFADHWLAQRRGER